MNLVKELHLQHLYLFFFVMIATLGCREAARNEEGKTPGEKGVEEQVVSAPQQIISLEEAKELYDTYTRRRAELILKTEGPDDEGIPFEPARFAAFDYNTIKQYMAFIEQEAASANVDISTLRFYFGNYGEKEAGQDKSRRNTVFLVPTTKSNGQDYGFYIATGPDGKPLAEPIRNKVGSAEESGMGSRGNSQERSYAGFAKAALLQSGQSLVLNKGNSGPPPQGDF